MLTFLDILLTVTHTVLVVFVLTGWAFDKTRNIHFWSVAIILFAWLVIGWWVGTIGYCPLTDLHWDIRRAMGETPVSGSFIKYMLDGIFHQDFDRQSVDRLTGISMVLVVTLTAWKRLESRWLTPVNQ